jgi:hypothetical protein
VVDKVVLVVPLLEMVVLVVEEDGSLHRMVVEVEIE